MAGRAARKAFFREIAEVHNFRRIALAHTRDDRVETFLMNLLRGAGPEGLVSMAAVSGDTIRPLIDISRNEVEKYLEQRGESWRTDTTNFDLALTRNRLRHKIIPMLSSEFNPRLTETLARTVEILEDENAWMRTLTSAWLDEHGSRRADGFVVDVDALSQVNSGLLRRIIRLALSLGGSSLQHVSFTHIEAVCRLVQPGQSGKSIVLPHGIVVARSFNQLIFQRRTPLLPDYSYDLQIPGLIHIPERGTTFRAEVTEVVDATKLQPASNRVFVDRGSLGAYVRIRNWMPGDYYRPVGLPAGKLKKLFQQARIPRSQRGSWPVLVANSAIVWVASFPVSREFAAGENTRQIVAFEASP